MHSKKLSILYSDCKNKQKTRDGGNFDIRRAKQSGIPWKIFRLVCTWEKKTDYTGETLSCKDTKLISWL